MPTDWTTLYPYDDSRCDAACKQLWEDAAAAAKTGLIITIISIIIAILLCVGCCVFCAKRRAEQAKVNQAALLG